MIKKAIISPPFGNYISLKGATSVRGTYTLKKRKGLILQVLKTVRPVEDGWVNKIGFRNPGIKSIKNFKEDAIYSIAGFNREDWRELVALIPKHATVEVNISCPNVGAYDIDAYVLSHYVTRFKQVSVKIPPTDQALSMAIFAYSTGVRLLHLCNTLPSERGGISGKQLKEYVLPLVKQIKARCPLAKIIAGGGIYSIQDVKDYKEAGADYFSLSTIFLRPWKLRKVYKYIDSLTED